MDPHKILIVQLRRVGDVLLTEPVAANLRKRFPRAQIDFLAEPPGASLLRGNPNFNEILVYDKNHPALWIWNVRRRKYDWILDYLGNPRTLWISLFSGAKIRAGFDFTGRGWAYNQKIPREVKPRRLVEQKLDLLRKLGVPVEDAQARVYLNEQDRSRAKVFWTEQGWTEKDRVIGLAPTSRRATRRWTPRGYAELADRLISEHGFRVLFFWGPGEEDQLESVMRLTQRSPAVLPAGVGLRDMAGFLERCAMLVANSNGPMHLAEAAGTPTLTIYGPNAPEVWEPGGPKHRFIQAEGVACLRCNLNRCPTQHECMEQLSAKTVERNVLSFWDALKHDPTTCLGPDGPLKRSPPETGRQVVG